MAATAILARFPLGVYRGHTADGRVDAMPSPLRLFSALVHAAHTGSTAIEGGMVSEEVGAALDWFEDNPPAGLLRPRSMPLGSSASAGLVAYRDMGVLEKKHVKKGQAATPEGMALAGSIGWFWEEMPARVRTVLKALCDDVPCLGENDSPVVLEVVENPRACANWQLEPEASVFDLQGLVVSAPMAGRRATLASVHASARPPKAPSQSADRFKDTETISVFPAPSTCARRVIYVPTTSEDSAERQLPWVRVHVLWADDGSGTFLPPEKRVAACVTLHKAIVRRVRLGVPSLITGHYGKGETVPANRVAIQYVPATLLTQSRLPLAEGVAGAFLVLEPVNARPDDRAILVQALAGLTGLTSWWGSLDLTLREEVGTAHGFWRSPPSGTTRLWSPLPVAVPEVTRQRGGWTFEDAILLSLGFVWRNHLEPVVRGADGYRNLVRQVRDRDAGVLWHRRITSNQQAYVHRVPESMVVHPYQALISTGDLGGDADLLTIGQSRHLGGGLLAPVDVPQEMTTELGWVRA